MSPCICMDLTLMAKAFLCVCVTSQKFICGSNVKKPDIGR